MITDSHGNAFSYRDRAAIAAFEDAIADLHAYRGDPIAKLDAILTEHPRFALAHAARAGMIATSSDRAFDAELRASVSAAIEVADGTNDRERCHIAAVRAWAEGDFAAAVEHWGQAAILAPRDLLAVQLGQLGDFLLGQTLMLRDRVARVLPAWDATMPGYGHLLGMHAFGLEECGEYGRAEQAGRAALGFDPADGWAAHAVAHVMEMTGRAEEGEAFLAGSAAEWTRGNMLAYHNWWHLALFRLERGDIAGVLALHDERIAAGGFGQAMELVDGTALLWRLMLLGHDVGDRWAAVAEGWRARIDHGWYAFNDWHAMMAFVGAEDRAAQLALLGHVSRAAEGRGTNAAVAREVGLPLCRGVAAFGAGDPAAALERMMPVRAVAQRMGGSHAQRDALSWTLVEAALRAGDAPAAQALASERLVARPHSPLNLAWMRRAATIAEPRAAA